VRPCRHDLGNFLRTHFLFKEHAAALHRAELSLCGLQLLLQAGQFAELQLGSSRIVVPALCGLHLVARLLDFLLEGCHALNDLAFAGQPRVQRIALLVQVGQLTLQVGEPRLGRVVAFLFQRLPLDLELHNAALDLVQLCRVRCDLHAQPASRLVDQVDCLVGQEAVGDVAMRQGCSRDDRAVSDAHVVVHLVAFLKTAQDRDGVLHRRLVDEHGLEAALERGIFLDVLAVFVQRRRADRVQLPAREHGLEHVARVHRALCRARADYGVQLVDEEDDLARAVGDFLQHSLEPLLELAAILGARHERAHVERDDALVFQPFGHVPAHDALAEAFHDGGLAYARLADEHRVVLGTS